MLQSDLCGYSDAYIVVEKTITVTRPNNNAYDKKLAFKNNAPFIRCISKIDNALIDNAEDLDIAMPMYNLIEYSDEPNSGFGGDDNNIHYSIKDSKYFDFKTTITGKLEDDNIKKGVEIVVPLKYLSNFWRTLDMPLISCEVSLILTWSENCVLTSKAYRTAVTAQGGNPAVVKIDNPTDATFKKADTKLYVPVVTLSG